MTSEQNQLSPSETSPNGFPRAIEEELTRSANPPSSEAKPNCQNRPIVDLAKRDVSSTPTPIDTITATANPTATATITSQLRRLRFTGSTLQCAPSTSTRRKSIAPSESLMVSAAGISFFFFHQQCFLTPVLSR